MWHWSDKRRKCHLVTIQWPNRSSLDALSVSVCRKLYGKAFYVVDSIKYNFNGHFSDMNHLQWRKRDINTLTNSSIINLCNQKTYAFSVHITILIMEENSGEQWRIEENRGEQWRKSTSYTNTHNRACFDNLWVSQCTLRCYDFWFF